MITEEMYLLAKKIVDVYENKQLKQAPVSGSLPLKDKQIFKKGDVAIYRGGADINYNSTGDYISITKDKQYKVMRSFINMQDNEVIFIKANKGYRRGYYAKYFERGGNDR